ncbi:HAD family hydrolase [Staphylococcus sp. SQ8-PEA]|uniref:HAD family hydrolase n=1 Tax=Staphylococcus marylandisciuri TaxID=2981529 RepID=A0ABT2QRT3_9STAP|nr:HAD family hydrolase [Staphylococcus marylandisciuri]MCU5746680.1 HAD family hydrolase [Staphylococcus marylandisciuri]
MYTNYIFDFDGTIADSSDCGIIATQKAFRSNNLEAPTQETIDYYMGIPIEESFPNMCTEALSTQQLDLLIRDFRSYYKEVEQQYIKIVPGMDSVIQSLSSRNCKLFVVSSKHSTVLERNLKLLDLDSYFTEVVGSDKVTEYKPHPDGLNYILNQYSLAANDSLYIGDAKFDIQMAHAAGIHSCAVAWGSHSETILRQEEPTYVVASPKDILTLR